MPRFFVDKPVRVQGEVTLYGQEAHHMQRVLRLGVGDTVDLLDGAGTQYRCKIAHRSREAVTVRILEVTEKTTESPLSLVMGQSLIKGDKMDFVIQKATELGVSEFMPFASARSVMRLEGLKREQRVNRWRRIAMAASKQCGRMIPLEVHPVMEFDEVLEGGPAGAERIILWEREIRGVRAVLRGEDGAPAPRGVFFLVGPEGGFSEEEIRRAEETHFITVGLGPRILRAETAGLIFASILQYEWGDIG